MGIIQDARRGVYSLSASGGEHPRVESPYVFTLRFDPAEGAAEEEIAAWYREEHFPRLCALEAVVRARLFRRNEVSDVKTAETKMQGNQEGQQAFLAFYEMSTLDPIGSDGWKEAAAGTARSAGMLKKLADPLRERWWWDFVKYAPGII
ncbi:MAG: hypothetical protein VCE91_02105 [Nitrospinota bacterium]